MSTKTSQTNDEAQFKIKLSNTLMVVGAICIFLILVLLYYILRDPKPTTPEILWEDFKKLLPYLIVGSISLVFGFLDLYEKFSDFGIGLPLTNKYGHAYLLFNTLTPMVLLYGYENYFTTIGVPEIGDEWLTAFVVALAFPLLIRSKFFTYTNASGDTVSVGFDQLYDRLIGFFVREIQRSSKVFEKRHALITKCAGLFTTVADLQNEAFILLLNHTEWSEDRKNKEQEKINKGLTSASNDPQKKLFLASYILSTNGEDYLEKIMLNKAPKPEDKTEIRTIVKDYKASLGRELRLVLSR